MPHKNIEIKARCEDIEFIKNILEADQDAQYEGLDHQIDTYFVVKSGRLKLRRGDIENYLIYYAREDIKGPKKSNIILIKDPSSDLEKLLLKTHDILTIVDKQRDIYFIGNVKIHLDQVKELGTFVEIEVIDAENNLDESSLYKRCQYYMELFEIKSKDLITCSYSNMLLEKKNLLKLIFWK